MVVFFQNNRGSPILTTRYYDPYYGTLKNAPLILGNSHIAQAGSFCFRIEVLGFRVFVNALRL